MTDLTSRLEINIKRLLNKCESVGRDYPSQNDWRLETYLKAVSNMLYELQKESDKPKKEVVSEYSRRIEFLKKLVDSKKIESPVERVVAMHMLSHGVATAGSENVTQEIHQKISSKYNTELREQLFRIDTGSREDLRQRQKSTGEDMDAILKYHHSMQEKIAEDMLLMTQNLKHQSQLSADIIRKDTETMQKSAGLADNNLSKLKVESAHLELHNKRAWKCWMWVMILLVLVIFVNMVLFMKLMKKRI